MEDTKTDIGWGHQIRSYVLDQSRIKDLRTNYESATPRGYSTEISSTTSQRQFEARGVALHTRQKALD